MYVNSYTRSVTSNDLSWINSELFVNCYFIPDFFNKVKLVSKVQRAARIRICTDLDHRDVCANVLTTGVPKLNDLSIVCGRGVISGSPVKYFETDLLLTRTPKLKKLEIKLSNNFACETKPLGESALEDLKLIRTYPFKIDFVQCKLRSLHLESLNAKCLHLFNSDVAVYTGVANSQNMLCLRELTLSRSELTEFTKQGFIWKFLKCMPELEKLDLTSCELTDNEVKPLCECFGKMPKLKIVSLDYNQFSFEEFKKHRVLKLLRGAETISFSCHPGDEYDDDDGYGDYLNIF